MQNQPSQNYSGQNLTQPVMFNGTVVTNPQIAIPRKPFLLERYYFDKLIRGESLFFTLANTILGSVIGLFINMLAKLIGSKIDKRIIFDSWEVYAFLIALALMIICYLIHYFVPNERKRIITQINEHFKNS
jgi:uncharacterized BrkB/YihY/UPF0761 family membrane protein